MNIYDIEYPYQISVHMSKRTREIFDEWLYRFIGEKNEQWNKFRIQPNIGSYRRRAYKSYRRPGDLVDYEYLIVYGFKTKEMLITLKLSGILEEIFDIFKINKI